MQWNKRKRVGFFLLLVMVMVVQSSFAQTDLFNGKDLTGWDIYGTEKWYVENGLLVCESGPDEEYVIFRYARDIHRLPTIGRI